MEFSRVKGGFYTKENCDRSSRAVQNDLAAWPSGVVMSSTKVKLTLFTMKLSVLFPFFGCLRRCRWIYVH